jgi:hypothetical protein
VLLQQLLKIDEQKEEYNNHAYQKPYSEDENDHFIN